MITKLITFKETIEVGQDYVSSIELTNHGNDKTTIYKITYADESVLFLGLREHEVERDDGICIYGKCGDHLH